MNIESIHLKLIEQLQALDISIYSHKATIPANFKEIVDNIVKDSPQIDKDILATALSIVASIPFIAKHDITVNKVQYSSNTSFIHNKILYLTNPYDEDAKQQFLNLKSQGKVAFTKIGVVALNHQALLTVHSGQISKNKDDNQIVALWQKILSEIQKRRPEDIHFEPFDTNTKVVFRISGDLENISSIERDDYERLVNLFFNNAGINNASFNQPQQGKLIEEGIEFRLQTIQTNKLFKGSNYAPKTTLRAHYKDQKTLHIDGLGLSEEQTQYLKRKLSFFNHGCILISGPTGSGKTSLLYACLNYISDTQKDKNIHTIEDPVEIDLPNITQTPANSANNDLNYAALIPCLLRSDIDIALIAEIRDKDTAKKALEIALTGHTAFSTIHANNATDILVRLQESFEIKRDVMASVINVLIGQRLIKKVCQHCSTIKPIKEYQHHQLKDGINLDKYYKYLKPTDEIRHLNPKGCSHCQFGYIKKGLFPVAEIMSLDEQAKKMIATHQPFQLIRGYLLKEHQSMFEVGVGALKKHKTSVEELEKIPLF